MAGLFSYAAYEAMKHIPVNPSFYLFLIGFYFHLDQFPMTNLVFFPINDNNIHQ